MKHQRRASQSQQAPSATSKATDTISNRLLRSANLKMDISDLSRLEHYRPTSKAIVLLRSILATERSGCFMVVAPYGSGKSIGATFAAALAENYSEVQKALRPAMKKIGELDSSIPEILKKRGKGTELHAVLLLEGAVDNLTEAIDTAMKESFDRLDLKWNKKGTEKSDGRFIGKYSTLLEDSGVTRISIVWDEFGRHLESLVETGRASQLNDVQRLAEEIDRLGFECASFTTLLHRNISQYATHLSQSTLAEWRKIEGRFETLNYIESSRQIIELMAGFVEDRKPRRGGESSPALKSALLKKISALGLIDGISLDELGEFAEQAAPLSLSALILLPRLSAKVAQHERTLFTTLSKFELKSPVRLTEVFDAFTDAMRQDVGLGGSLRLLLETQSALKKISSKEEEAAVKALAVLSLALSNEKLLLQPSVASLFLQADLGITPSDADSLIERLKTLKVLLHRQHSDELSIWQGAAQDLRGKIAETRERLDGSFSLENFLKRERDFIVYAPLAYNAKYGMRRFFCGYFVSLPEFESFCEEPFDIRNFRNRADGYVFFVLAFEKKDIDRAKRKFSEIESELPVLAVLPEPGLNLRSAALEVACLQDILRDKEYLSNDPLIQPEIQEILADAQQHFAKVLQRFIQPGEGESLWVTPAGALSIKSEDSLQSYISSVCEKTFSQTPRILCEALNRNNPSPQMVNARRKALIAVLERGHMNHFGLDGASPDVSIVNTVLVKTGIVKGFSSHGATYAKPMELRDSGLNAVWNKFEYFFTEPTGSEERSFSELFSELRNPPFGMRDGLIPVLFGAALQAFPSVRSIQQGMSFLQDILPTTIEEIFRNCAEYSIRVSAISEEQSEFLKQLLVLFSPKASFNEVSTDLIRQVTDAIEEWQAALPQVAHAMCLQKNNTAGQVLALLKSREKPIEILFEAIPALLGTQGQYSSTLDSLKLIKLELERSFDVYLVTVTKALNSIFDAQCESSLPLSEKRKQWLALFPAECLQGISDGLAKRFVDILANQALSDEILLEQLAGILVGRAIRKWEDAHVSLFESQLHNIVSRIETFYVSWSQSEELGTTDARAAVLVNRITTMAQRLEELIGAESYRSTLSKLLTP